MVLLTDVSSDDVVVVAVVVDVVVVVVIYFCAAASLYDGSVLLVLNYVSDEGFGCPVVVIAADSEESLARLWWAVVVLMVSRPHRMHLVVGVYRSSYKLVGLRLI